jgi:hypothetical protein
VEKRFIFPSAFPASTAQTNQIPLPDRQEDQ